MYTEGLEARAHAAAWKRCVEIAIIQREAGGAGILCGAANNARLVARSDVRAVVCFRVRSRTKAHGRSMGCWLTPIRRTW